MATKDKKDEKKIITVPFRVSFPDLIKAKSFNGSEPKYGVQMVFPNKGTPFKGPNGKAWTGHDIAALKKLAIEVRNDKWGTDKTKYPKKLKMPFIDGNTKDLDSHKDATVLNAKSKFQIPAVDANGEEILQAEIGKEIYAGSWARARLTCYAYEIRDPENKKTIISAGVAFGLSSLQKVKDDKPFAGGGNAKDDFDAVELEDEEFDEDNNDEDSGENEEDEDF